MDDSGRRLTLRMNLEDSMAEDNCGLKEYKYSDRLTINEMGIGDGEGD